jgi:hypothetical protein
MAKRPIGGMANTIEQVLSGSDSIAESNRTTANA